MDDPNETRSGLGLDHLGAPLAGTDARPGDELGPRTAPAVSDAQGGENEQQDERRAHALAQGADGPVRDALDHARASADLGSINDNNSL
jgi:hypothetical protein